MKQTVRIEDLKPGDKTAGGAIVQPASDDTTGRPKRLEWHENGERFWLAMENCRRVFGPTVEVTREEDPLEPFEATVIDWCYEDGCLRLSVDDPYPDEDALEFGSKVYVRPAGYVEPKPPLPQDVAEAMYHLATCGIEWVQTLLQFIRDNWLSNRVFHSEHDIVDHCCDAWNQLIDQPWRIMSIGLREWAHRF